MRKCRLFTILLLLAVSLMSCQMGLVDDRSVTAEEGTDDPVLLLQASLEPADSASRSLDVSLPVFGLMTRDVTLTVTGNPADIPLAGVYEGKNAVTRYFADFHRAVKITGTGIQDVLSEGTGINAHFRLRGYARETRRAFDLEYVYAMTFRGRQISSITIYYDTFNFRKAMTEKGTGVVADVQNPTYPRSNPRDTNDYRPMIETGIKAFYVDGDIPTFFSLLHPDVYWVFKGDAQTVPFAGLYHGMEGMMQFLMAIGPNYLPAQIKITGSIQQGNRLDYFVEEIGYAIPTGKQYRINVLHTFLIQDNKLVEFKTYNDTYAVSQAYIPN